MHITKSVAGIILTPTKNEGPIECLVGLSQPALGTRIGDGELLLSNICRALVCLSDLTAVLDTQLLLMWQGTWICCCHRQPRDAGDWSS